MSLDCGGNLSTWKMARGEPLHQEPKKMLKDEQWRFFFFLSFVNVVLCYPLQSFSSFFFYPPAKLREACFDPGSVMNGTRLGTDYKLGSSLTFHCEPGYQLQGYSTLTCVMGNTNRPEWNRALPSCQGDDDSLLHPSTHNRKLCFYSLNEMIVDKQLLLYF